MSALLQGTEVLARAVEVRDVPLTDLCGASRAGLPPYDPGRAAPQRRARAPPRHKMGQGALSVPELARGNRACQSVNRTYHAGQGGTLNGSAKNEPAPAMNELRSVRKRLELGRRVA